MDLFNINIQIRQRQRIFKQANYSNNEHIWAQFRTKRNSVAVFIRKAKQEHIEKVAKDLRSNDINARLWHKISSNLFRSSSKQTYIPFLETTSGIAETDNDKAEILNHYFASQSDIADRHSSSSYLELPNYPMLENIHLSPETSSMQSINLCQTRHQVQILSAQNYLKKHHMN